MVKKLYLARPTYVLLYQEDDFLSNIMRTIPFNSPMTKKHYPDGNNVQKLEYENFDVLVYKVECPFEVSTIFVRTRCWQVMIESNLMWKMTRFEGIEHKDVWQIDWACIKSMAIMGNEPLSLEA